MATDFLWAAGTNGYISAPFMVLSTELNALTSGAVAVASVGGSAGLFSNAQTNQGRWGAAQFSSGGSWTPSNSLIPALYGWFLQSLDGGSTIEYAVPGASGTGVVPERNWDFMIPLAQLTYPSGSKIFAQGPTIELPSGTFGVAMLNSSGVSLPSTGNTLTIAAKALQY